MSRTAQRHGGIYQAHCLLLPLFIILAMVIAPSAYSQSRTYTLDADFDEGTLVNVNHNAPNNDQLQLNSLSTPLPFIWVAASGRGTIVRIDVNTGQILGEFISSPNGRWRNPSRTTVDLYGNVWVGNRDEATGGLGSVIKIGLVIGGTRCNSDGTPNPAGQYLKPPFAYNTAVDRDMDGLIKTSYGLGNVLTWNNAGGVDDMGGVSTADDECILIYKRVNGDNTRHVSVDANNNVWVSGNFGADNAFDLLDGTTGAILASFDVGVGGYGGLIDGNGVIWVGQPWTGTGDDSLVRHPGNDHNRRRRVEDDQRTRRLRPRDRQQLARVERAVVFERDS